MEDNPLYRIVMKREALLEELRSLSSLRAEGIDNAIADRIRELAYGIVLENFALSIAKPPVDQRGKYRHDNQMVTK